MACKDLSAVLFSKVGNVPDKTVFAWPNLLISELFVLCSLWPLFWLFRSHLTLRWRARERHAPAYFLAQSPLVLPGAAGDGELLGVLGWRGDSHDLRLAPADCAHTWTAVRRVWASGFGASGCWPTRSFSLFWW